MGTIIRANSNKIAYGIKELVIDTDADLQKLNVHNLTAGTTVFSIESSQYYILNSAKEWKKFNSLGSGTSTSDIISLDAGSIDK